MSQRDGATVRIYSPRIKAGFLNYAQCLRGEGFVQLDHVDVGEFKPRELQCLGNRIHRAKSHFLRFVSGGGERDVAGERRNPQRLGSLGGHNDRGSRAVGSL